MLVVIYEMNAPSSPICSALLWRFSNPTVDHGLPLKARPQTDPA